jgi:outer membrane autotransporter protein
MERIGGWFRGIGDFDRLSGTAGMPGFTTSAGGFLAGIDRPVGDHAIAGIAAGYSHIDLSQSDGERGKIDTPRIALYGSDDLGASALGPWSLDGTIGYGYDRIAASRSIAALGETASSNHDAHEANAALQARTRLLANGITVTPAIGLQYTHLFEMGFTESGASGFDLSVARRNSDSLRPFIGASARKSFMTGGGVRLTPEADLTYSHELFNTPPSLVAVGGGSFTVAGLVPSRDALTVGGSISADMTNRLALFGAYHATLPTGNLLTQTVEAGLSYKF